MGFLHAILRDFSKGLNTQALPSELADDEFYSVESTDPNSPREIARPNAVDGAQFPALLNFLLNYKGRLRTRDGLHKVMTSLPYPVLSVYRFAGLTSGPVLVFNSAGTIYTYNETTGAMAAIGSERTVNAPCSFVEAYTMLYQVDGLSIPQKWNGASASMQNVGIAAPPVTPTAVQAFASSGNLIGTYQYAVTYYNTVTGLESNPSPYSQKFSTVTTPGNGGQGSLTTILVSPDPQVNARNIYRTSGTGTALFLIATIADNTTTTYTDNLADTAMGSTTLNLSRNQPTPALSRLFYHKNRLWGIGDPVNPSRLYCSSFGQPEYWPTLTRDLVNDGGYLDIDASSSDALVALSGTGSLLILGKTKGIYALFGDDFSLSTGFVARKISSYGVAAANSMVRCNTEVVYLASNGQVYSVAEGEPVQMSRDIEPTLAAVALSDLRNACAAYYNQRYFLFIPQVGKAALGLCYDFRTSSWSDMSDQAMANALFVYADEGIAANNELLIVPNAGYTWPDGTPYNGIISAMSPSDTGPAMPVKVQTPAFEFGRPMGTKRAKTLRIEGALTGTSTATVSALTPGETPIFHSYSLLPGGVNSLLLETYLPADMVGAQLQVTITGTVTAMEINTIDLGFVFLRQRSTP